MVRKKTNNIRKLLEFQAFTELIRGNTVAHWGQIANVLGVNKDTVNRWKKHPIAQKAIIEGISKALIEMEKAGSKDWRMWESKLMLGVSPISKQDLSYSGEVRTPKPIYSGLPSKSLGPTKTK